VNHIPGMDKETLVFQTKDEQRQLLQRVLQASDADAEEEDVKEEVLESSRESRVCLCIFHLKQ
jgi:DNA excision repair protein ERCC-3